MSRLFTVSKFTHSTRSSSSTVSNLPRNISSVPSKGYKSFSLPLTSLSSSSSSLFRSSSFALGNVQNSLLHPPSPSPLLSSVGSSRSFSTDTEGLQSAKVDSKDGPLFISPRPVRNLAVIAHVDHGKTSLVDMLVRMCVNETIDNQTSIGPSTGTPAASMDSNPLERERGITILSKATCVNYKQHIINIVDTPGHADFGGEVERVLNMVDGVLLVVDAQEGPMPQTRYVLGKALAKGLRPIVVLNKCDRDGARLGTVENEVFDLFVALEANDEQLDFPFVYASAREGWTSGESDVAKDQTKRSAIGAASVDNPTVPGGGMAHLLDTILKTIPAPRVLGGPKAPFSLLVSQMEMDTFLGKLVLGRISSGSVKVGDPIVHINREGTKKEEGKVLKLFARRGTVAIPLPSAEAGDIIQLAGLQSPIPTSTVAAPAIVRPLFADPIDPPTISMSFSVNDSPLGGKEGTSLTSTMIAERLAREAAANIALEVQPGVSQPGMPDATEVRGRGELQLAVLIETMRREGFELSVSPPAVLFRTNEDGQRQEPYEEVVVDVDNEYSGGVIEKLAIRKGNLRDFSQVGTGKVRLNFLVPSRGLIGFQSDLKTDSRGTAVLHRRFEAYGEYQLGLERKPRGVMVANTTGTITAYALDSLQARGVLFAVPGDNTYMGHIIGECSKDDKDMDVNPVRAKKLTNVRATGHDEAIRLSPPRVFGLEEAIVYVAPDELVEVTPSKIRLRKRILNIDEREKMSRNFTKAMKAAGQK